MKLTKEEKNVVIAGLYELQRNHKPGDDYDLYIQKIINKIQKENKKCQKTEYKIYPRSKVEKLVTDFIVEHKIYAEYGTDDQGVFEVRFIVKED